MAEMPKTVQRRRRCMRHVAGPRSPSPCRSPRWGGSESRVLFFVVVQRGAAGCFVGGDAIVTVEPAAEIEEDAALGAERPVLGIGGFATDRAAPRGAGGGGFAHGA